MMSLPEIQAAADQMSLDQLQHEKNERDEAIGVLMAETRAIEALMQPKREALMRLNSAPPNLTQRIGGK